MLRYGTAIRLKRDIKGTLFKSRITALLLILLCKSGLQIRSLFFNQVLRCDHHIKQDVYIGDFPKQPLTSEDRMGSAYYLSLVSK